MSPFSCHWKAILVRYIATLLNLPPFHRLTIMSAELATGVTPPSLEKLSIDDKSTTPAGATGNGTLIDTSIPSVQSPTGADAIQTPNSAAPGGTNQPHTASLYVGELDRKSVV